MTDQTKAPERIWIAPTYRSNGVDDFYLLDPKYRGNRGTEYIRADLAAAIKQRDELAAQYTTACRIIEKMTTERDQALAENERLRATLAAMENNLD